MKTEKVIQLYGSKAQVAKALGISRQAVGQWGDIVPYASATIIAHKTTIPLVRADYPQFVRAK